jgi:predicted nucleic acid-binding protein
MPNEPQRVVFDCVVFAQTLISETGPSGACVELARWKQISLVWSAYVIQEVRELPLKLKPKYGVTPERVEAFIHDVAGFATFVDDVPSR